MNEKIPLKHTPEQFRKFHLKTVKFERLGMLLEEINSYFVNNVPAQKNKIEKYFESFLTEKDGELNDFNNQVKKILTESTDIYSLRTALVALRDKYKEE